jgi:hypothetical protein
MWTAVRLIHWSGVGFPIGLSAAPHNYMLKFKRHNHQGTKQRSQAMDKAMLSLSDIMLINDRRHIIGFDNPCYDD